MRKQPSENSIAVLRAVVEGKSLVEAGRLISRSPTTAGQHLIKACRAIGMPSDLSEIRKNKAAYLGKIKDVQTSLVTDLNHKIASNLEHALKIPKSQNLTPQYASNISASQLAHEGLTYIAIAEIQMWLRRNGLSLKQKPPQAGHETVAVKRAVALLDAFHFDAKSIQKQLANLESSN
jgi:hypothetical protein